MKKPSFTFLTLTVLTAIPIYYFFVFLELFRKTLIRIECRIIKIECRIREIEYRIRKGL